MPIRDLSTVSFEIIRFASVNFIYSRLMPLAIANRNLVGRGLMADKLIFTDICEILYDRSAKRGVMIDDSKERAIDRHSALVRREERLVRHAGGK